MDEESTTIEAWNSAAEEYSELVREQLKSKDKDLWMELVYRYAPKKEKLRVLDIGTGPGFFAISLAMDGHAVTGIDLSIGMLKQAEKNAHDFGVNCIFHPMNADNLLFDSNSFDLIINRNVTWTIPNMMDCYKEWRRVLSPGGRILIFDSNFNWNFFDPEHDRKFRELIREMKIAGVDSGSVNTGFMFRNSYMETRPMLGMPRPQWDRNMLIKLRYCNIITWIDCLIGTELDRMPNPEDAAPLFLICAEKPSADDERKMLIEEYWNGVAPFDSGTCHRLCEDGRGKEYFANLEKHIRKGKLLDLACGAGFLTIAADSKGFEAIGIDSSKEMIKEAKRCASEVSSKAKFIKTNADEIPFDNNHFDSIIIRNSLWAFDEPEKILKEAIRVLNKDGVLIIIDSDWISKLSTKHPAFNDDGVRIRSGETGFGGTDVIDPIFRSLPLTIKCRPEWEISKCQELGMELIESNNFDDILIDKSIREIVGSSFISVFKKV